MRIIFRKKFIIEYITIYISIIIVTIVVQTILLRLDIELVLLCLAKSIFTTIPNVIAIMFGKKIKIIKKTRIREAFLFTFTSLPYLEIVLVYVYETDIKLSLIMIGCYIVAYFFMGIFNRPYLKIIKRIVTISINTPETVVKKTFKFIRHGNVKDAKGAFFFVGFPEENT